MSRPLRSTPTPVSRSFTATTSRSASEPPPPVLNASGIRRWHAPSRDLGGLRPRSPYRRSPSLVPCKSRRPGSRRLHAGHHLARTQAPARLLPKDIQRPPVSMPPHEPLRRLNSARPTRTPGRTLLERLPGPHLTQSSRAFSPIAHHDSLQLTQHQGGLAPTPAGRRWRANKPPSLAQHRL
jgi:hypothetical protein